MGGSYYAVDPGASEDLEKPKACRGVALGRASHVPGQSRARRAGGQWTNRNRRPIELVAGTRRTAGLQRLQSAMPVLLISTQK